MGRLIASMLSLSIAVVASTGLYVETYNSKETDFTQDEDITCQREEVLAGALRRFSYIGNEEVDGVKSYTLFGMNVWTADSQDKNSRQKSFPELMNLGSYLNERCNNQLMY